jgi:hypothetical protein
MLKVLEIVKQGTMTPQKFNNNTTKDVMGREWYKIMFPSSQK